MITKSIFKMVLAVGLFTFSVAHAQDQTAEELKNQINTLSPYYVIDDQSLMVLNTNGDMQLDYYSDEDERDNYSLLFNIKNDFSKEDIQLMDGEYGLHILLTNGANVKFVQNGKESAFHKSVYIFFKTTEDKAGFLVDRFLKFRETLGSKSEKTVSLSKEETVRYLDKKIKEIYENYRTVPTNDYSKNVKFYYIEQPSIFMSGDRLNIVTHRANSYKKIHPSSEKIYVGDFSHQFVYKETIDCDYREQTFTDEFNPAHIISINKGQNFINDETVGIIEIKLKSKTGKQDMEEYVPRQYVDSMYGKRCIDFGKAEANNRLSTDVIQMVYLQSDDTNFNKIKKALEHLQSLLKEEDDPFAN